MNRKILLFLSIIFISAIGYGQNCTCESNFEWMKKTFEENDASFQYTINIKGQQAYDMHNTMMLERIKSAKNSAECSILMLEWLKFFRSGHLGIEWIKKEEPNTTQITSKAEKKETIYESLRVDIPKFEKYLKNKNEVDFEGIWETGQYKIGIKKEKEDYIGFIVSSGADEWKPYQVKLKLVKDYDKFKSIYYMRDHSAEECGIPEWIGNNYFKLEGLNFTRVNPIFPDSSYIESYFRFLNTRMPYFETLNSSTLYLRIPSFDLSFKKQIDSILTINKEQILKTKNLIIDVRNNGGGGDGSFKELIPLLYTNPIREVSVENRSTILNNQQLLDLLIQYESELSEDTKKQIKDIYEKQKNQLGKFVNMTTTPVNIDKLDTIYPYPENIGIIINKGCASSTEQFLLAAKQSKKVKLFGTATYGAVDYGNLCFVESPCKEFVLSYCMSKSMRLPDMALDESGIQPDFYLDKTIQHYKWVEFVNEVLNQQ